MFAPIIPKRNSSETTPKVRRTPPSFSRVSFFPSKTLRMRHSTLENLKHVSAKLLQSPVSIPKPKRQINCFFQFKSLYARSKTTKVRQVKVISSAVKQVLNFAGHKEFNPLIKFNIYTNQLFTHLTTSPNLHPRMLFGVQDTNQLSAVISAKLSVNSYLVRSSSLNLFGHLFNTISYLNWTSYHLTKYPSVSRVHTFDAKTKLVLVKYNNFLNYTTNVTLNRFLKGLNISLKREQNLYFSFFSYYLPLQNYLPTTPKLMLQGFKQTARGQFWRHRSGQVTLIPYFLHLNLRVLSAGHGRNGRLYVSPKSPKRRTTYLQDMLKSGARPYSQRVYSTKTSRFGGKYTALGVSSPKKGLTQPTVKSAIMRSSALLKGRPGHGIRKVLTRFKKFSKFFNRRLKNHLRLRVRVNRQLFRKIKYNVRKYFKSRRKLIRRTQLRSKLLRLTRNWNKFRLPQNVSKIASGSNFKSNRFDGHKTFKSNFRLLKLPRYTRELQYVYSQLNPTMLKVASPTTNHFNSPALKPRPLKNQDLGTVYPAVTLFSDPSSLFSPIFKYLTSRGSLNPTFSNSTYLDTLQSTILRAQNSCIIDQPLVLGKHPLYNYSNIWVTSQLNYTIRKRFIRYVASDFFRVDLSFWYYKTLIHFIENCSGRKVTLLFGPFIENTLSFEDKARCSLWNNRVTGFQRIMGSRIFVHEALSLIVTSIRLKDPTFLSNWIRGMLKRLSFWKYRLIFRYIKFVLRYVLKPNFHLLGFRGVKLQLKGKISVAGNARTRTLFMRIGDTSHSKMRNRVSYDLSYVNTFTGILGFKLWFFY